MEITFSLSVKSKTYQWFYCILFKHSSSLCNRASKNWKISRLITILLMAFCNCCICFSFDWQSKNDAVLFGLSLYCYKYNTNLDYCSRFWLCQTIGNISVTRAWQFCWWPYPAGLMLYIPLGNNSLTFLSRGLVYTYLFCLPALLFYKGAATVSVFYLTNIYPALPLFIKSLGPLQICVIVDDNYCYGNVCFVDTYS